MSLRPHSNIISPPLASSSPPPLPASLLHRVRSMFIQEMFAWYDLKGQASSRSARPCLHCLPLGNSVSRPPAPALETPPKQPFLGGGLTVVNRWGLNVFPYLWGKRRKQIRVISPLCVFYLLVSFSGAKRRFKSYHLSAIC